MASEPKHDGGAEDLIAQDAAGPHILQFRSPAYVAKWIDERHVIIGGGGNNRFGMTNGLALLRVDPTETRRSSEKEAQPLWRFCGSVDLRGNILWCVSNLEYTNGSDTSPTSEAYLCLSHLDSFSVIRCRNLNTSGPTPPTLQKMCRVLLQTDDPESGEPEKKPVAIARGVIFAAQDDGTLAVFKLSKLLKSELPATPEPKSKSKDAAPPSPSNDSFTSFSSLGDAETKIDIKSRINDISARAVPWDAKSVLVMVACKDKHVRVVQFNTERMTVTRTVTLPETSLGFKAGSLMRSSLRVCASFDQQLPNTANLSAPQRDVVDPRRTNNGDASSAQASEKRAYVNVCFVLLSLVDGKGYIQRLIFSQADPAPKVDVPRCIGKEAPTAVTQSRMYRGERFTYLFVATAEGTVIEFIDQGPRDALKKNRVRRALHVEAVSAIAVNTAGAIVSADIAQRVIISWMGKASPRHKPMLLFPRGRWSSFFRMLAVLVAFLVLLLAYALRNGLTPLLVLVSH